MSLLAVISLKGDPERLASEYEKMTEVDLVEESSRPTSHAWMRVEDGMVVADWWDSEEGLHSFMERLRQPSVEDEGPKPQVELLTVRAASHPEAGIGPTRQGDAVRSSEWRLPKAHPWMPAEAGGDDFDSVLELFDG